MIRENLRKFSHALSGLISPKRITREVAEKEIETAPQNLDMTFGGIIEAINKDKIISGSGLEKYQEMLRDPFVKTALSHKKQSVVSLPFVIQDGGTDPIDRQIGDFVRFAFEDMSGLFETFLLDILDGVDVGYSILEKNYRIIQTGDFKGSIGLKNIKGKNPDNFEVQVDEFGNLVGLTLKNQTDHHLNIEKFIFFSYLPRYGDILGSPDLRAAHRAVIMKELAMRFRAIYLQKFAVPTIVGKMPRDNSTEGQRQELLETIAAINEDSAIVTFEDVMIEAFEISASTQNVYRDAINDLNKEIVIGILGAFLQSMEGTETGARSIGEVHERISNQTINFLSKILAAVVTDQVIVPLVDLNFPSVERYPFMTIDIKENIDLRQRADIINILVGAGLPVPVSHVLEQFNIPVAKEGEAVLEKPAPAPLFDETAQASENDSVGVGSPGLESDQSSGILGVSTRFSEGDGYPLEERTGIDDLETESDGFVNVTLFAERNDRENLDLSRGAFEDSIGTMDALNKHIKKFLKNHPKDIKALVKKVLPKASALQEKMRNALLTGNMQGRAHVAELISRDSSRFAEGEMPYEVIDIFAKKIVKPLSPRDVETTFKKKLNISNRVFDDIKKDFSKDAEVMAEKYVTKVAIKTQNALSTAVAEGALQKDFIASLSTKTMRVFSEAQLKTAYRNEVTTSYTLGRIDETRDPDVAPFIAFWEYVTMGDASVRDEHAAVAGTRLPEDDPFWNLWMPPNGHNCRCQALPISTFRAEANDLEEVKAPTGVEPDEGFDQNMFEVARSR